MKEMLDLIKLRGVFFIQMLIVALTSKAKGEFVYKNRKKNLKEDCNSFRIELN